MGFSAASTVHGYVAIGLGFLLAFAPAVFLQYWTPLAGTFGVTSPPLDGAALTLCGIFLIGFGTAHAHTGATSRKASAGMVCSESAVVIAAVAAGYLQKQPFFYFIALAGVAPFALWGYLEYLFGGKADKGKAA